MILEPVTPFRPREYAVKVADQAWEQRAAAALRRRAPSGRGDRAPGKKTD